MTRRVAIAVNGFLPQSGFLNRIRSCVFTALGHREFDFVAFANSGSVLRHPVARRGFCVR
jgi:hypothetical protein